jgi:hypothetical protein
MAAAACAVAAALMAAACNSGAQPAAHTAVATACSRVLRFALRAGGGLLLSGVGRCCVGVLRVPSHAFPFLQQARRPGSHLCGAHARASREPSCVTLVFVLPWRLPFLGSSSTTTHAPRATTRPLVVAFQWSEERCALWPSPVQWVGLYIIISVVVMPSTQKVSMNAFPACSIVSSGRPVVRGPACIRTQSADCGGGTDGPLPAADPVTV